MMGLPSRQVAQRDLTSHTRLKLRRSRPDGSDESVEERLKRLRDELEEREKKAAPIAGTIQDKKASIKEDFDDADELPSSSSDEEEDDSKPKKSTNELEKELERIRKEKMLRDQAIASTGHNPLLDKAPLQRRWDDDVIFRNQSKDTVLDKSKEKRLVNDVVHSDTHKQFMKKYIL